MEPLRYITDWAIPYYLSSRYDLASSGIPDPGFPFPDKSNLTQYADIKGIKILEEAQSVIASYYGASPEQVTLTMGGSGAILITAFLLAQNAPYAISTLPEYEPLHRTFESLGREVRYIRRRREDNYSIAPLRDEILKLAKNASCVTITNPNNPTGLYDPPEVLTEIAKAIYPAWLVVNEIYLPLIPGARSAFGLAENIIILTSMTKSYGISAPRCGWIVSPKALSEQFLTAEIYVYGRYSATIAAIMLPILKNLDQRLNEATAYLAGRNEMVDNAIKSSKRLRWICPPGKVILGLVSIDGVKDDLKFAKSLLEKREVITGPGHFFNEPGAIRIGLGAYSPNFDEAFARFFDFAETYCE